MTKIISKEEIEKIKARADAATGGPWCRQWENDSTAKSKNRILTDWKGQPAPAFIAACEFGGFEKTVQEANDNAHFIAHARTDIPALVESHEELSKQYQILEKAYETKSIMLGDFQDKNLGLEKQIAEARAEIERLKQIVSTTDCNPDVDF